MTWRRTGSLMPMRGGEGRFQRRVLGILRRTQWRPSLDGIEFVDDNGRSILMPDGYDSGAPTMPIAELRRSIYGSEWTWGEASILHHALVGLERRGRVRLFWVRDGDPFFRWVKGKRRSRERAPRSYRIVQYRRLSSSRTERI
jgi:hypothetical protein